MNRALSDEEIQIALAPFVARVTTQQVSMFRKYLAVLLKWNRTLSLTTIVDPIEIIARHFGESLFGLSVLPVENGRLADVGSGAGFPGLALKIGAPALSVTLVESNRKKCVFLAEVVRALGLKDVDIFPLRFEEMSSDRTQSAAKFDFITARALGDHHEFLKNAKNQLTPRGHVMMWLGGDDVTKLTSNEDWIWQPAVRIPDSQRRFVLTGRSRRIERQV